MWCGAACRSSSFSSVSSSVSSLTTAFCRRLFSCFQRGVQRRYCVAKTSLVRMDSSSSISSNTFHKGVLSSPTVVFGPVERGSDLPFREMLNSFGVKVSFSHRLYATHLTSESYYCESNLITSDNDTLLISTLCANDVDSFAAACNVVKEQSVAVCLDLAWGTQRAKNGGYGRELWNNPQLVLNMVEKAVQNKHKVMCLFSCACDDDVTVITPLVKQLEEKGCVGFVVDTRDPTAEVLTNVSLSNWDLLKSFCDIASVPVYGTGSLNSPAELSPFLKYTGASALVADVELMQVPYLFAPSTSATSFHKIARDYLRRMKQYPLVMPSCARAHLAHLTHLHLVRYPNLIEDLKHANTPTALSMLVDELMHEIKTWQKRDNKEPKIASEVDQQDPFCDLRPMFSHTFETPNDPVYRYSGDEDQRVVARTWVEEMKERDVICDGYANNVHSLFFDENKSVERRLNRLAKKKALRTIGKKQKKEKRKIERKSQQQSDELETKRSKQALGTSSTAATTTSSTITRFGESPLLHEGEETHGTNEKEVGERMSAKRTKQQEKRFARARIKAAMDDPNSVRVAVDMGLGDAMSRKEILKLSDQVRRLYGLNMGAEKPVHLCMTSLDPTSLVYKNCVRRNAGFKDYLITTTPLSHVEFFNQEEIVFLTPDSPNVIVDLNPGLVYVMGGLVDEQIIKNYTMERANKAGIKTASLPIKLFSNSEDTKYAPVLSINQVLETLLEVYGGGSWTDGLNAAVPKRKGFMVYSEERIERITGALKDRIHNGIYCPPHANVNKKDITQ
eukprot:m.13492 g.13492  ORF g.13492 m.13492 type:complete len:790 (+) comp7526_c0_seq1:52-2421(+)